MVPNNYCLSHIYSHMHFTLHAPRTFPTRICWCISYMYCAHVLPTCISYTHFLHALPIHISYMHFLRAFPGALSSRIACMHFTRAFPKRISYMHYAYTNDVHARSSHMSYAKLYLCMWMMCLCLCIEPSCLHMS